MNMLPQHFAWATQQAYRCWRRRPFVVKCSLLCCLRGFDLRIWAPHFLAFCVGFAVSLKGDGLRKTRSAMSAPVNFCKLSDIFDQKRVSFINSKRNYFLKVARRILSEVPNNFTVFLALRLIDSDALPTKQRQLLIKMTFYLIQFIMVTVTVCIGVAALLCA